MIIKTNNSHNIIWKKLKSLINPILFIFLFNIHIFMILIFWPNLAFSKNSLCYETNQDNTTCFLFSLSEMEKQTTPIIRMKKNIQYMNNTNKISKVKLVICHWNRIHKNRNVREKKKIDLIGTKKACNVDKS